LKGPDEDVPEEFGRALKRPLFLSLAIRLYSESFEINHLIVSFDKDSFIMPPCRGSSVMEDSMLSLPNAPPVIEADPLQIFSPSLYAAAVNRLASVPRNV